MLIIDPQSLDVLGRCPWLFPSDSSCSAADSCTVCHESTVLCKQSFQDERLQSQSVNREVAETALFQLLDCKATPQVLRTSYSKIGHTEDKLVYDAMTNGGFFSITDERETLQYLLQSVLAL